ncbi:MAG TPA: molecular chaperone DnaK, partial [Myxococcales bacterium]|nr:molecular chaperone DnaK [Myxococcales bacterium]
TKIPVQVSARFTEVGTLELWCEARQTDHRWRLQFQLRGECQSIAASAASSSAVVGEEQVIDESRLDEATQLIRAVFTKGVFTKSADAGEKVEPQTLARELETVLGTTRDSWPLSAIRCLWDVLWEDQKGRGRSPEHEARWLNLAGFLLRPGFGHPSDEWRMQQLWKIYGWGLTHAKATQCRAEWWNMWKRVAGGLSRQQQTVLYTEIAPCVLPQAKNQKKSGGRKVGPQEIREMWQVAGSCERMNVEAKNSLGETLVRLVEKSKVSAKELWTLSRLGARALIYGPANCVVRKEKASRWVERLLKTDWPKPEATAFAVTQIARYTGDRSRDLDEGLRERVAERLATFQSGQRWAQQVREVVRLEAKEQARILDESLPVGLQIRSGEHSAAT